VQKFQPLRRDLHAQARHAGEVASWPAEAADQPDCDWVGTHLKDNWDRCSRRFCRERGRSASRRDNHGYLMACQIRRQRRQSTVLTLRPAKFDCHISTLDISGFAETLAKSSDTAGESAGRFSAKISNHGHRQLLRTHYERPCSHRTSDKRDEVAPSHCVPGLLS
jgi:hypothetical protein